MKAKVAVTLAKAAKLKSKESNNGEQRRAWLNRLRLVIITSTKARDYCRRACPLLTKPECRSIVT